MFMRVTENALIKRNEKFYLNEELFTGIVYFQSENLCFEANYVNNGILGEQYFPFCVQDKSINIDDLLIRNGEDPLLELEGEAIVINSTLYHGFLIWYDKNFYIYSEEYYEDGLSAANVDWDANGYLTESHIIYENLSELASFKDNVLFGYGLGNQFGVGFQETTHKLCKLTINKNFFQLDKTRYKYIPIESLNDILKWKFDEDLYLEGDFIDNNYIDKLINNGKLTTVRHLILDKTNLNSFDFLLSLSGISFVEIITNEELNKITLLTASLLQLTEIFEKKYKFVLTIKINNKIIS